MSILFTLETTPRRTEHIHKWADYIEMLCMINIDGEISADYVIDRVRERDALEQTEEFGSSTNAVKWTTQLEDWFRNLRFRQGTFRNFYPFELGNGTNTLRLKASLSPEHFMYIYFLLSANLGRFDSQGGARNTLTNDFEYLSCVALKNCLPGWNIHIFGKGPFTDQRYRGNTWTKLNALAQDINETVRVPEAELSPNSTGDEGLDIVGWIPFDGLPGLFSIFGQCACGEDWMEKQHTVDVGYWRNRLTLQAHNNSITFIPYCYRNANGGWYTSRQLCTIVIDRVRFVQLLQSCCKELESLDSYTIIQTVLDEKESLF